MNDTSEKMAARIVERHRQMTPETRMRIASQMFDTARTIVESSLPANLSCRDRRLALIERLYKDELSPGAKLAFATFDSRRQDGISIDRDVDEELKDSDANRVLDSDQVQRRSGLQP